MSFEATVSKHMAQYEVKLKEARDRTVMNIVNEAQKTVSRGGRMPVDTGYLRRSIRGALGRAPKQTDGSPMSAVLSAGLSDDIVIGWHAEYAWYQEITRGFMRGALSNAQISANKAVKRL